MSKLSNATNLAIAETLQYSKSWGYRLYDTMCKNMCIDFHNGSSSNKIMIDYSQSMEVLFEVHGVLNPYPSIDVDTDSVTIGHYTMSKGDHMPLSIFY